MAESYCYIGRKPCGCAVAAAVDDPQYKKQVAKDIADWIRKGLTVERVPTELARRELKSCKCESVPKQESLVAATA